MKKNKVAFQGELGAYSHIAINELFESPEIKTCATFEETFKAAYEDEDYKIVIPLENSLAEELLIFIICFQNINYKFMLNIFNKLNII